MQKEASRWVLFLDMGVESVHFGFSLVPSHHFLPEIITKVNSRHMKEDFATLLLPGKL